MNCFEYNGYLGSLIPGIAITWESDVPYIPVFASAASNSRVRERTAAGDVIARANFGADLADRLRAVDDILCRSDFRISHCNAEKRSEAWLTLETPDTQKDALILCTVIRKRGSLEYTLIGRDAEILATTKAAYPDKAYSGYSMLVKLTVGSELTFTHRKRAFRKRDLDVLCLKCEPDGTITKAIDVPLER